MDLRRGFKDGNRHHLDVANRSLSLSLYIFIATVVVGMICNGEERTIVSAMMNI